MLPDIYLKRGFCELFNGGNVVLPVQLVAEPSKIVYDSTAIRWIRHEPKRRTPILSVAHDIVPVRRARVLMPWGDWRNEFVLRTHEEDREGDAYMCQKLPSNSSGFLRPPGERRRSLLV